MVETLDQKIEALQLAYIHEDKSAKIDKEKINKIFEKRQIGRPVGTWDSKREQYHDMLIKGKIKQPKQGTLDYYQIYKNHDDGTYHLE